MKKMHDETHDGSAPPMKASAAGSSDVDWTTNLDNGYRPAVSLTERAHSLGAHLILKALFERETLRRQR
jgi:hypothetical protein